MEFSFSNVLFVVVSVTTLVMLFGSTYNYFRAPRLEKSKLPTHYPKVSLLIPARNEAENMLILLPLLNKIAYPNLEIIILNDHSEDATADRVKKNQGAILLMEGKALPKGWLGKNWACQQLSEKASGDILLFCDADVMMSPESVTATVAMMEALKLDALTCLPKQIMGTWAEKAVLPVLLFMPVLGFMPLDQISKLAFPTLSLGCGQWFAFTRSAYQKLGEHAIVKDVIVEDMALGRIVKENGFTLGAVISSQFVATRMYTSFSTVWNGFSKNLAYLTGTGWIRPPLIIFSILSLNLAPFLFVLFGQEKWIFPLSLLMLSRLISAVVFAETTFGWLWSPLGAILIPLISIRSWWGYRKKNVQWKGRVLTAAFD